MPSLPRIRISSRAKGGGLLALGAILLAGSGLLMQSAWRASNGRDVEGRVSSVDVERGEIQVRFPGLRSPREETFSVGDEAKRLRPGRRVQVIVVDEERAHLQGHGPATWPILALLFVGGATIGVGAFVILRPT